MQVLRKCVDSENSTQDWFFQRQALLCKPEEARWRLAPIGVDIATPDYKPLLSAP
jgi:hypothetical protein